MATYTNNLNLKKPNAEDFYNIADFNGNADILDTAIASKADASTINSLEDAVNSFTEYINDIGGFKKYTTVGTHTFKVPIGVTSIKVSGIGAGGGGGGGGGYGYGGSSGTNGGGGGSGGHGYYLIDQQISVTAGEILTIQIENGGSYGLGAQGKASGGSGSTGGTTKLLRGETELFTVNGGTGGNGGAYSLTSGTHGAGGKGGTLNGNDGEAGQNINYSNVDPELRGASGGAKATSYLFGDYGAGGKGGRGSYTISFASYAGKNGSEGTNGALVICFGNVNFSDISYEKTTIPHLYLSDWRVSTYIGDIWHRASFKMLTSYNPLAYNLETFKQMVGTNVGSIDHMIFKYNILSYSNSSDYLYTANIKNNVFSCTFGNAGSGDRSVSEDDYTINIILNGKYQIF